MDSPPAKRTRLRQRSNPQRVDHVQQHLEQTEDELDEELWQLRERNGFEHWTPDDAPAPAGDDNTSIATNTSGAGVTTQVAQAATLPSSNPTQTSQRTILPTQIRQQHPPPAPPINYAALQQQALQGQLQIRYINGSPYVMIPADRNQQRVFLEQQRRIALARQQLHNPQGQQIQEQQRQQIQEQQRALGAQFAAHGQQPMSQEQRHFFLARQQQQQQERQRLLGEQFARDLPYAPGPGPGGGGGGGGGGLASSPQAGPGGHVPPQALPAASHSGQRAPFYAPYATQAQQTTANGPFHPALHQRTYPQPQTSLASFAPLTSQATQAPPRTPSLSRIWRPDYSWIQKQLGPGEPPPQRVGAEEMSKLCRTYAGVNLDSKAETEVPEFWFPPAQPPDGGMRNDGKSASHVPFEPEPFSLLHTPDVVTFCVLFKKYLLDVFGTTTFHEEGIVRMETLALGKLDGKTEGYVLWAEDACQIGMPGPPTKTKHDLNLHGKKWRAATIVAVLIPQKGRPRSKFAWEKDARFFYTADTISLAPVLTMLDTAGLKMVNTFPVGTVKYRQLATWLQQSFLKAVIPPDSQDYKHAMVVTDCCPDVLEPEFALERLETNQWLHFSLTAEPGRDLEDDRYLHLLHPVEREAASLANLKCAEYLFIKRGFFKAFYEEIYRTDKKIDPDASSAASGRGVGTTNLQQASNQRANEKDETPAREDTPMATSDAPAPTPARRQRGRPSRRAQEAAASLAQMESNLTSTSSPLTSLAATPEPPTSEANAVSTASIASHPAAGRESRRNSTAPNPRSRVAASAARKVRVRTHNAHRNWLRNEYGFSWSQAERLVLCWTVFGFLEEGRFLDWVRGGGMFEVGEDESEEVQHVEESGEVVDETSLRSVAENGLEKSDGVVDAPETGREKVIDVVEDGEEDAEFELDK